MDSPERSRNYLKRETKDSLDGKREMIGDDEDWEGNGKRRHRLSKSRRSSNGEEIDGLDGSGRRKSFGERNESRRTVGGSTRGDTDEGDFDAKDVSSKLARKKQEVSDLEKLSNWYQDGDVENRHDGGDNSGSRSHNKGDDSKKNTLRKSASKFSDHEGSHRSRSKEERVHDGEDEKAVDKEYHSERRENTCEKGHGFTDDVKNRRKWDDSDSSIKADDSTLMGKSEPKVGSGSESKHENSVKETLLADWKPLKEEKEGWNPPVIGVNLTARRKGGWNLISSRED